MCSNAAKVAKRPHRPPGSGWCQLHLFSVLPYATPPSMTVLMMTGGGGGGEWEQRWWRGVSPPPSTSCPPPHPLLPAVLPPGILTQLSPPLFLYILPYNLLSFEPKSIILYPFSISEQQQIQRWEGMCSKCNIPPQITPDATHWSSFKQCKNSVTTPVDVMNRYAESVLALQTRGWRCMFAVFKRKKRRRRMVGRRC